MSPLSSDEHNLKKSYVYSDVIHSQVDNLSLDYIEMYVILFHVIEVVYLKEVLNLS